MRHRSRPVESFPAHDRCGHGVLFSVNCEKCERSWAATITLPNAQKTVARLLMFYSRAELIKKLLPK